jgi:flagellar biosynthesis protein
MTKEKRRNHRIIKHAVALSYSAEAQAAPVVKAKGKGAVAERIAQIAAENGVPVREDASLVEVLSKLDLDQEIPPELYKLVAEILSFVYRADQEAKARLQEMRDDR